MELTPGHGEVWKLVDKGIKEVLGRHFGKDVMPVRYFEAEGPVSF